MKDLTQDKLDLMFSHINSVPRKSLGGKTPYEAFEFFYSKETLDKLHIQKIEKDKVTLYNLTLFLLSTNLTKNQFSSQVPPHNTISYSETAFLICLDITDLSLLVNLKSI